MTGLAALAIAGVIGITLVAYIAGTAHGLGLAVRKIRRYRDMHLVGGDRDAIARLLSWMTGR